MHQVLFRWSMEDFRQIEQIWNGDHPEDGLPLVVEDGIPEGVPTPDLDPEPQLTAPLGPDIDGEVFKDVAERMFGKDVMAKAGVKA